MHDSGVRDLTWMAMGNVAKRMSERYCVDDTLRVTRYQRRNLTTIIQGLQVDGVRRVGSDSTVLFEGLEGPPTSRRRGFQNRSVSS
jgi:hypothetical protein